jgi:hypothetical protein
MSIGAAPDRYGYPLRYDHSVDYTVGVELWHYLDRPTAQAWCPPGWRDLVLEIHRALLLVDPDYKIAEIKEKFGQLRYTAIHEHFVDCSHAQCILWSTVDAMSILSLKICQWCGSMQDVKHYARLSPVQTCCILCYRKTNVIPQNSI